jgi:zinc/manganese transport system substrate-binding protein
MLSFKNRLGRMPAVVLLALAASFCLPASAQTKKNVVASFSILGDIVSNVGKDRITVTTLVGPDQDAHVFQVTPEHLKTIARADLIVVNGLGFEGWQERVLKTTSYRGDVVVASKGIAAIEREDDHDEHDHDHGHAHDHAHDKGHDHAGHDHGPRDPHAWQDPRNVIVYTRNIAAALSKLDPAGASVYEKNAAAYIAKLTELDQWAQKQFGSIPKAKRQVITSHDAFAYFGARYQVQFLAPQGLSTDSEPSARDVANLIRQIKTQKINAVFVENMASPRLIQQINQETGTRLGGKLYADALSKAGGDAPDYITMMRFNVMQLVEKIKQN